MLKFLQKWRQARRDKMISKILPERDRLRRLLIEFEKFPFPYMWARVYIELDECNNLLRKLGYKEPV